MMFNNNVQDSFTTVLDCLFTYLLEWCLRRTQEYISACEPAEKPKMVAVKANQKDTRHSLPLFGQNLKE